MPAINVARTDTFEIQRQKINQIGSQVFTITEGGSDLATGNLKLGDGTKSLPSLAFTTDNTLGLLKENSNITFVSSSKKLFDLGKDDGAVFYKDVKLTKNSLLTSGLNIVNSGENYDTGIYTNIPVTGGTGEGAEIGVTVLAFVGQVTNAGRDYNEGSYLNVITSDGSEVNFEVEGIQGFVSNAGSGYVPAIYNVSLTNVSGSGTGAEAEVLISGTTTLSGSITNPGSGYTDNTYNYVIFHNNPTQTFTLTSIANPGTPPPDNVYVIDGNTQQSLTLIRGNTYRFDVSDASVTTHPLAFRTSTNAFLDSDYYQIVPSGYQGTSGAYIDLVIKEDAPLESIKYICASHEGMGADITITSGSVGNYGHGAYATVEVASGQITSITFTGSGEDYKQGDVLTIPADFIGGTGSGFEYTLGTPVYTGEVTSVTITNNGSGYLLGDILSANVSDLGGFGGGFQFTIDNDPEVVTNLEFVSRATSNSVGTIITLPTSVTGVTTSLNGSIENISATLSNASAVITVADTTGIAAGMNVLQPNAINDIGQLALYTTVISVDSATQITLSDIPTASGTAVLNFSSPGTLNEFVVSSTQGIYVGSSLVKTAGIGSIQSGTTVTDIDEDTNTITISSNPNGAGSITLSFIPPWGDPVDSFTFEVQKLGSISEVTVSDGGNGYVVSDILSVNPSDLTQPIEYTVTNKSTTVITFTSTLPDSTFTVGSNLKRKDGSVLTAQVTTSTTILGEAGQTYTGVAATGGSGSGATFDISRDPSGDVFTISVNDGGYFYSNNEVLTISGVLVGGSSPTDDVQVTVNSVTSSQNLQIYTINSSGGNISSMVIDSDVLPLGSGDMLVVSGTTSPEYELDTTSIQYRFFIDSGSGATIAPNLNLFVGNNYKFDLSDVSNSGHTFSLSKFRDGIWSPSYIQNVASTLNITTKTITVFSSAGILPGMAVSVSSGTGRVANDTFVDEVNGNDIVLTEFPTISGSAVLEFRGVEYLDGVQRTVDSLTLKVTDATPTLYYYCSTDDNDAHLNEGGIDGFEASLTIDPNNPKVFGSGFQLSVSDILSSDVMSADILTGEFTATSLVSNLSSLGSTSASSLNCSNIIGSQITLDSISAIGEALFVSANTISVTATISIGSGISINSTNGNITTTGVLKSVGSVNINDDIIISNNEISSTYGNDLVLSPASGSQAKVDSTTALVIPVGNTDERPPGGVAENGSIRFNTETNQYEGYNSSTSSWSSLGGVRDIDGNTYILAELTAGANDNTLWFYNDNINTLKLTSQFLDFRSVKKISSGRLGLPLFSEWTANTAVVTGQYVKYKNNIYEVTAGGTTATSGNEPVHTSGVVNNGTAQLTWYSLAVSPLSFSEIEELRVAPDKNAPLVVNASLKFGGTTSNDWNTISTISEDLTLRPSAGKKVVIDSTTHFAIPAGNNNQKNTASAIPGSIRFNTEIQQFEGYSGSNWSSLGGVRDVDGNTYIVPETAPAANENILYFYNDNLNTLQLSKTSLDFTNIDTITTSGLNNLSLDTPLVTLNLNETTIDNRDVSRTFISSSKQYLDLGLSSGLVVDPILRLDDQGDVYLNTTFGSGTFNGVKVFDGELKEFELADYALRTESFSLGKGAAETSAVVLYPSVTNKGCKVTVVSKSSSGKRSMTEYHVIDNGTDIFYNEFGSLNTSLDQYTASFDYNATNEVRITLTLSDDHANGDIISFTVLNQVIK